MKNKTLNIQTKDLRDNPKPRVSPEFFFRGNIVILFLESGRGMLLRVDLGRGTFTEVWGISFPGISGRFKAYSRVYSVGAMKITIFFQKITDHYGVGVQKPSWVTKGRPKVLGWPQLDLRLR